MAVYNIPYENYTNVTGNITWVNSETNSYKSLINNYETEEITGNYRIEETTSNSWIEETTNSYDYYNKIIAPKYLTGTVGTGEIFTSCTLRYGSGVFNKYVYWPVEQTKTDLLREKLRSNLAIIIKSRVELPQAVSHAERVAMETLREFISETEFRKYLRYGFVLVKGKSGDTFQIYRNRAHTKVWRNGRVVEEVCVRIKSDAKVPPTDNVIAFRSIIQSDEDAFRKLGNVYKMQKVA